MYVHWGSGRAKCSICKQKITDREFQVSYRGYKQSESCHILCLVGKAKELWKELPLAFDGEKILAEMKEFVERGQREKAVYAQRSSHGKKVT
jgi:hypothetical protein